MVNSVARRLRKNETVGERKLWKELRLLRAQGYHFRRQAPIEAFIVDFVCFSHRIVIEVDGYQHDEYEAQRRDADRDAHLRWQGFTVLRFRNGDVSGSIDGVVLEILAALGAVVKQE